MRLPPLEIAFLRSKVARRVFLLFFLSALVPLVILAWLSITQVEKALDGLHDRELSSAAKTYGMALYERLLALEETLHAGYPKHHVTAAGAPDLSEQFVWLAIRRDDSELSLLAGRAVQVPPLPALAKTKHAPSTRLLFVKDPVSEARRVVLARHVVDVGGNEATVFGEPTATALWGDPEALPFLTDLCVLTSEHETVNCSNPLPTSALAALRQAQNQGTQRLAWGAPEDSYRAATWSLFLAARFDAPSLLVVASQPRQAGYPPVASFRATFLAVVGLTLLFVTLLTVVQVRKRLVPLEELVETTRRIGNGDFAARVKFRHDDEFGELADALQHMAEGLGRQFTALDTWSQMDRMILSDVNIEKVLDVVLSRLPDMVAADVIALTILEGDTYEWGRTYFKWPARDGVLHIRRTQLSATDCQSLANQRQGHTGDTRDLNGFTALLHEHDAIATFVLPVFAKDRLVAAIQLGYRQQCRLQPEELVHAHELADRLAVTLSAAEHEEQLYFHAHYDTLTSLPNRLFLRDRLAHEISQAHRGNRRIALLFIDLDRFKDVNDTLGHAAGDRLLQIVAARLRGCVRETDTVGRLGGDEFTVILSHAATPRDVQVVAENVMRVISEPVTLEGRETFVSGSIGVAVCPDDATTSDELLRKADTAMYRAKQGGRRRYVFFEERMNTEALERVAIEQDLHRGIGRSEFVLHYQPQIDMRTGQVVGAEALLRWQHPERGLLPPSEFIGIAENAGLIELLGEHVLRASCRQFCQWIGQGIACERLAINVSSRQFRQTNFADSVRRAMEDYDLPAHRLELEITESLLLQDVDEVVANFTRLHAMGLRLVIDDFGTGYSSLAYLKRFPIDAVKIDRSFIRDIPSSDDAATLTDTIIAMARTLKKDIVAEGVETEAQLAFLRSRQCHYVQGYYVSKPLSVDAFERFMRTPLSARRLGSIMPVSDANQQTPS